MQKSPEKICGNCQNFDTEPKNPVNDGEGLCHANLGLVLGVLHETNECRKPNYFIPKPKETTPKNS